MQEKIEKAREDPNLSDRDRLMMKQTMIRELVLMEKEDEHITRTFPDVRTFIYSEQWINAVKMMRRDLRMAVPLDGPRTSPFTYIWLP